jgi:hypothetical protein
MSTKTALRATTALAWSEYPFGHAQTSAERTSSMVDIFRRIPWQDVCKFLVGAFFVNAGILFYLYLARVRFSAAVGYELCLYA